MRLLLCLLLLCLNLEAKEYAFKIKNTQIASTLSKNHQGASVFLSYPMLESLIEEQLLANGFVKREAEPFVEFLGKSNKEAKHSIIIRGDFKNEKGLYNLTLKIDGRFYKETLLAEEILIDAEVGIKSPPKNFMESFTNVIGLPINLVLGTVISLAFPFINSDLTEANNYLNASFQGKFNPASPLISIAKSVADFFLGLFGKSTGAKTYPITLKLVPQKQLLEILDNLTSLEIGADTMKTAAGLVDGMRIQIR